MSLTSPCSLSPTLASPCFPRPSLQGSVLLKTLPLRHCSLFIMCPPPSLSLGPLLAWTLRRASHDVSITGERVMELTCCWVPMWAGLPQSGKGKIWKACPCLGNPVLSFRWWLLWKREGVGNSCPVSFHPDSQVIDLGVQMSSGLWGLCLWKRTSQILRKQCYFKEWVTVLQSWVWIDPSANGSSW